MNILIQNAEIITMNEQNEILYGDILIKDDRIVEIKKKLRMLFQKKSLMQLEKQLFRV